MSDPTSEKGLGLREWSAVANQAKGGGDTKRQQVSIQSRAKGSPQLPASIVYTNALRALPPGKEAWSFN
jgi:hypothetical protein